MSTPLQPDHGVAHAHEAHATIVTLDLHITEIEGGPQFDLDAYSHKLLVMTGSTVDTKKGEQNCNAALQITVLT